MDARNTTPSRRTRRSFLLTLGGVGAAAIGGMSLYRNIASSRVASPAGPRSLVSCQRTSRALGTEICMVVLHEDAAVGQLALDAAFAELAHVERAMSIYLPETDLSRLNREGVLRDADPYLIRVLHESYAMAERSGGAFDVTVQPLWTLYAAAQKFKALPSDAEIDETRRKVDYRGVQISGRTVRLRDPGMAVTLNGIAQGFAADRAMEAIKRCGIAHALVNTGEIASLGNKAAGRPWTVGIQHPREPDAYLGSAKLDSRCISTSGDYETAFSTDKAYNHIFEPRTGRSPMSFSSVTVVAANATDADALSTAIFVLGPEKGMDLAREFAADVLLVAKDGRQHATPNFPWNS